MIVRTYEQAKKARTLTRLVVATDDARIEAACEAAGAEVVRTDAAIPNGTERCESAAEKTSARSRSVSASASSSRRMRVRHCSTALLQRCRK